MLRTQLKQLAFTATIFSLSGNSFFMHKYTYASDISMCVCCVCICMQGHTLMHAGAGEGHRVSLSVTVYLIPLRQGFSLILELGEWPASPSDPATSLTT